MNPDRAVEYLTNGIPPELQRGGGDDGDDDGGDDGGAMETEGGGGTPGTWAELSTSPAFRAEIAGLAGQAELMAYLDKLKTEDPAKLALIQGNAQVTPAPPPPPAPPAPPPPRLSSHLLLLHPPRPSPTS